MEMQLKKDIEIYRVTKNFRRCLRWVVNKGLIPETRECPYCHKVMRIVNVHAKVKDGLMFKCTRLECRDIKVSIREGTIFNENHLTLIETVRVVFYYVSRGFNAL